MRFWPCWPGVIFSVSMGGNVEELLRAPQPTRLQSAVQKALVGYLGETPQMKYPRGGEELSPIVLRDLDGDGADEAIAFFHCREKAGRMCAWPCWSRPRPRGRWYASRMGFPPK